MDLKNLVYGLLAFALVFGALYAMSGASAGTATHTRWSGAAAGSVATEGGNITHVNVTSVTLTDKWAAFYGNISGTINLTNGTNSVYAWTWAANSSGEICLSENSTMPVETALVAATAANVNTAYSHGSAADNATNTFTATNCTLDFSKVSVSSAPYVKHMDSSTFYTCAVNDGAGATKADFLFCTNISHGGTTFHNLSYNYEIMVPTAPGTGSETYYFYVELD